MGFNSGFKGLSSFGEIWPACGRNEVANTEWRMIKFTCNNVYDVYDCMILLVPLTLREERRLRVLENRVLRRIFGPKRDEVTREWRKHITKSFMTCTGHQILFGF